MDPERRAQIEHDVLELFRTQGMTKLRTAWVFNSTPFANADLVRAFESLEKQQRLLVRYTADGDDWLHLTAEAAERLGIPVEQGELQRVIPHPPKISS